MKKSRILFAAISAAAFVMIVAGCENPAGQTKQNQDAGTEQTTGGQSGQNPSGTTGGNQTEAAGNYIKSEDDLVDCVLNVIKQYYAFAKETGIVTTEVSTSPSRAASRSEITEQLKALIDAYITAGGGKDLANWENLMRGFVNEGYKTDLNFEKKVDLKDITPKTAFSSAVDITNNLNSIYSDSAETLSYEAFLDMLFGGHGQEASSLINAADRYVIIPELYLDGNITANKNATGSDSYAKGNIDFRVSMNVNDTNSLIKTLMEAWNNDGFRELYIPEKVNLPVNSFGTSCKVSCNVDITEENRVNILTMSKEIGEIQFPELEYENYDDFDKYVIEYQKLIKEYNKKRGDVLQKYAQKIAREFMCSSTSGIWVSVDGTESCPGGKLSLSVEQKYTKENLGEFWENLMNYNIYGLLYSEKSSLNLKVTDSDGKETFSKEYDYNSIMELTKKIVKEAGKIFSGN